MGATIAYELLRESRRRGLDGARVFFASGRPAPHCVDRDPPIHHLADEPFRAEFLRRYPGSSFASLLTDPEASSFFLTQLRADLELIETHRFAMTRGAGLSCPIVAIDCEDPVESVGAQELAAWAHHTTGDFKLYRFPGGHFFIDSAR
jgi:medium-chain acyl-[acyl-carrier-protein] hydrolase